MTVLAELRVSDPNGAVSFKLVVSLNMTMFNLHRVLQFCIQPRQSDSVIDCKPFTFTHVATGTLIRAVKGTQLYRANPAGNDQIPIDVGDAYTYEIEGKRSSMDRYLVEVVAIANGNDTNYVPRCISGNMDLDTVNMKLVSRKFPRSGSMKQKRPPALLCSAGTSNERLWLSHMNNMLMPLRGWTGRGYQGRGTAATAVLAACQY